MNIVFTAIFGGSDSLKPAPKGADRCFCFVDDESLYPDSMGWELRPCFGIVEPRREAWRQRCLPHVSFTDYSRVIWIDASFTLTNLSALLKDAGDAPIAALRHHARLSCYKEGQKLIQTEQARAQEIKPQLAQYRREGFQPSHLSISCIIVRDASETARTFSDVWAREIDTHLGDNTQVSLDYAAWKAGTEIKALKGTRHENPYGTHDHLDHKRRRRPYWVPA